MIADAIVAIARPDIVPLNSHPSRTNTPASNDASAYLSFSSFHFTDQRLS